MADAEVCARLSFGEPMLSLGALVELRALLDAQQAGQPEAAPLCRCVIEPTEIPRNESVAAERESRQEVPDDSTTKA
jgi:hypothetical protein